MGIMESSEEEEEKFFELLKEQKLEREIKESRKQIRLMIRAFMIGTLIIMVITVIFYLERIFIKGEI